MTHDNKLTDAERDALTEDEREHYKYLSDDFDEESQQAYVALARSRILSEARRKMLVECNIFMKRQDHYLTHPGRYVEDVYRHQHYDDIRKRLDALAKEG